ncbi:MAG: sigma-70 family RNA polymerase sigma factor [Myxococcota bacterium]|nr:sigma-70 family RNA polymerase sigma factor [Myxococcota bacterium]
MKWSRQRGPSDEALISKILAGEQEAFQMLMSRYERRAFGVAMGMLRNPDDAMDVVQEAFIRVYKHLPNYQSDCAFFTWLYRIVKNLCIDHYRKHGSKVKVEYEDGWKRSDTLLEHAFVADLRHLEPDRPLDRRQLGEALSEALDSLSDKHREVMVLREIEGLSYEEIAEIVGCRLGTVMSRLHHARKNLQRALIPYLESSGERGLAERAGEGVGTLRRDRAGTDTDGEEKEQRQ